MYTISCNSLQIIKYCVTIILIIITLAELKLFAPLI